MPSFISDDEFERLKTANDVSTLAEKADSYIRDLCANLETVKAEADAAAITAEQTCSLLEHKYLSLSSEFSSLESRYSQLDANLQQRNSELAQVQSDKHQLHLKFVSYSHSLIFEYLYILILFLYVCAFQFYSVMLL